MADDDLTPGSRLGPYVIEGVLGRGGMGTVYRAREAALDRVVALKLISTSFSADRDWRERFQREARLGAALEHAHIVPVYAAGEIEGRLFISMRFIDGVDLNSLVSRAGALHPARALDIIEPVAEALDAAHDAGLVHRDVKPANILVGPDDRDGRPRVYLTDFGLTRRSSEQGMTRTGTLLGTVFYMAPEQVEGRDDVGPAADQYALAVTLYEALSGRRPFSDPDTRILVAHLSDAPPPASSVRPDLGPDVDAVLARALAKAPEDRFPTCVDLVRALRAALPPALAARTTGAAAGAPGTIVQAPVAGGTVVEPVAGGTVVEPETGGTVVEPVAGGTVVEPETGGTVVEPVAGGTVIESPVGGTVVETPAGGTVIETPAGGTVIETPAGGTVLETPAGATTLRERPAAPGGGRGKTLAIAAAVGVVAVGGGAFALLQGGGGDGGDATTAAAGTTAAASTAEAVAVAATTGAKPAQATSEAAATSVEPATTAVQATTEAPATTAEEDPATTAEDPPPDPEPDPFDRLAEDAVAPKAGWPPRSAADVAQFVGGAAGQAVTYRAPSNQVFTIARSGDAVAVSVTRPTSPEQAVGRLQGRPRRLGLLPLPRPGRAVRRPRRRERGVHRPRARLRGPAPPRDAPHRPARRREGHHPQGPRRPLPRLRDARQGAGVRRRERRRPRPRAGVGRSRERDADTRHDGEGPRAAGLTRPDARRVEDRSPTRRGRIRRPASAGRRAGSARRSRAAHRRGRAAPRAGAPQPSAVHEPPNVWLGSLPVGAGGSAAGGW